jgi:hypothetical protein
MDDSNHLWIRNSGSAANPDALRIEPGAVATLPDTLIFSGNMKNDILLHTNKTFLRDDTIVARGVPYRAPVSLYVSPFGAGGAPVTLTIEPGVTLGFSDSAFLIIGSGADRLGVLDARGRADAKIAFTSAQDVKAAGDWGGITYRYFPTTGNFLEHATIEYTGAESGTTGFGCGPGDNDSAVIIYGQAPDDGPPDQVFISNTSFDFIGGTTVIVSGWTDDSGPDFSEGNTFGANTPPCKVSKPKRTGAGDVCDGGRREMCWD